MIEVSENEFFGKARDFLRGLGASVDSIDIDSDLIGEGILDSLSLVAFLSFLDGEQKGTSAPFFDLAGGLTLRTAYNLLRQH
jgi:aryl carrier-like protein